MRFNSHYNSGRFNYPIRAVAYVLGGGAWSLALGQMPMVSTPEEAPQSQAGAPEATVLAPAVLPEAAKPAVADSTSPERDVVLLTVDKKTMRAELKTLPQDAKLSRSIRTYRIAIGKQDGDKERTGDNKTPEGIYFTMDSFDTAQRSLPTEKYGPKAIPLNFPNPMDQAAGKTGHGIWLHGAGNDQRIEESKATEGCVAFYNSDVPTLERWLKPHQGIVVIAKDVAGVNTPDDMKAVQEATLAWAKAWDSRNLDQYIDNYSPNFSFKSGKRDAYRNYKKSVFAGYKSMSVKFTNIRVITHPKYALSVMNQDFRGDNRFASVGRKVLYWERVPGTQRWQITYEHHDSFRVELVSVAADPTKEPLARHNASSSLQANPPESL